MSYPQEPSPETLARFRELLLDTLHRQVATSDALDSKAWQALGVGSVVLGLGVAGKLTGWGLLFPLFRLLAGVSRGSGGCTDMFACNSSAAKPSSATSP